MIGAGETKTIEANTQKERSDTITPVVDLVLLESGAYFGKNACGVLSQYQDRIDERHAVYRLIMRRLQADGVEKTASWLKQELSRNIQPFRHPQKMP